MLKAHFKNIRKKLIDRIESTKKEIKIATRSFTSKELFEVLKECAEKEVNISLILVDYTHNAKIDWSKLSNPRVNIKIAKTEGTLLLTDNFMILDRSRVLCGSYDLTELAEHGAFSSIMESTEEIVVKLYYKQFKIIEESCLPFDIELFTTEDLVFLTKEEKINQLESQLEEEVYRIISMINVNNLPIETEDIIQAVDTYGATGALRRMVLRKDLDVSGFDSLIEHGFVNKTFESLVTQEKFNALFSKEVIEKAREKIS